MLSNANTNLFKSLHCGTFLSRRGCCTILFDCWVLLHCSPPFCPPIHPPLSLAVAAVALLLLLLLILLLLLLILLLLFVLLQVLLLFVAAAVCCCCCCCTAAIVAALLSALPTHPWWCLNLIVVFVGGILSSGGQGTKWMAQRMKNNVRTWALVVLFSALHTIATLQNMWHSVPLRNNLNKALNSTTNTKFYHCKPN